MQRVALGSGTAADHAIPLCAQITCSRSGGFSRDWADLAGDTLHWIGRNVLSVSDFTFSKNFYMEMSQSVNLGVNMLQEVGGEEAQGDVVVRDAVRGEVRLRRIMSM